MSELTLIREPSLREPVIIMGLAGWADAGGVSSLSISYIREATNASHMGYIDVQEYIDHTAHRPIVMIEDGEVKSITMPRFELYFSIQPSRDIITISGFEPINGWESLIKSLFGLVERFRVSKLITIGGLLDKVPHTRPVRLSFLASTRGMRNVAKTLGLNPSNYSGPGSIHSYIMHRCSQLGLDAISIWGHVPSYVNIPNPRVIAAVLEMINKLADLAIPLDKLYVDAAVFDGKINNLIEQNQEMREMVESLEREYDRREREPGYIK